MTEIHRRQHRPKASVPRRERHAGSGWATRVAEVDGMDGRRFGGGRGRRLGGGSAAAPGIAPRTRSRHCTTPPRHLRGVGGACAGLRAVATASQPEVRARVFTRHGPPPPPPPSARRQRAAMRGAPMPGACGHWVGTRGALASVRVRPAASGQRTPANRRRRRPRAPRWWELAHFGALNAGSAVHLHNARRGRASARRSAPTPPTAPIDQTHLRHAFGPARTARAALPGMPS